VFADLPDEIRWSIAYFLDLTINDQFITDYYMLYIYTRHNRGRYGAYRRLPPIHNARINREKKVNQITKKRKIGCDSAAEKRRNLITYNVRQISV